MARGVKEEIRNYELRITKGETAAGGHFRRSVWKGAWMNYDCGYCAFATLEPMVMAEHLRVVHGVGAAPAVDDGMPIISIEDEEVKE